MDIQVISNFVLNNLMFIVGGLGILVILMYIIILNLFRTFSRNTTRRYEENSRYLVLKHKFLGLFKKTQQNIAALKAQYDRAEVNVDKIVEALEGHEITLMKDISMMDKMYERNQEYMKELTMYILAGRLRIE